MLLRLLTVYGAIAVLVLLVVVCRLVQGIVREIRRLKSGDTKRITRELAPVPKCPICGTNIATSNWPICPDCGNTVQWRRSYSASMVVVAFVLSALIASVVGAEGDAWLWMTIFGAYPLSVVVGFFTAQFFPPDIEPTGDYRRILFGDADEKHSEHRDLNDHGHR